MRPDDLDELRKIIVRDSLSKLEIAHDSGNSRALMDAIRICADEGIPLPTWVRVAFVSAHERVARAQSGSWDEVLGKPYPNGKLHNIAKHKRMDWEIYNDVVDMKRDEPRTSYEEIYSRLAERYRVSTSTVRDAHRKTIHTMSEK